MKAKLSPSPRRELPDFLKNRGSVSIKKNPWTTGSYNPGSGGGINAGQGGASLAGGAASQGFRKPGLLK